MRIKYKIKINIGLAVVASQMLGGAIHNKSIVLKQLDPIEEFYNMYLEEEDFHRIVEVMEDDLDFNSDLENRLVDPLSVSQLLSQN